MLHWKGVKMKKSRSERRVKVRRRTQCCNCVESIVWTKCFECARSRVKLLEYNLKWRSLLDHHHCWRLLIVTQRLVYTCYHQFGLRLYVKSMQWHKTVWKFFRQKRTNFANSMRNSDVPTKKELDDHDLWCGAGKKSVSIAGNLWQKKKNDIEKWRT